MPFWKRLNVSPKTLRQMPAANKNHGVVPRPDRSTVPPMTKREQQQVADRVGEVRRRRERATPGGVHDVVERERRAQHRGRTEARRPGRPASSVARVGPSPCAATAPWRCRRVGRTRRRRGRPMTASAASCHRVTRRSTGRRRCVQDSSAKPRASGAARPGCLLSPARDAHDRRDRFDRRRSLHPSSHVHCCAGVRTSSEIRYATSSTLKTAKPIHIHFAVASSLVVSTTSRSAGAVSRDGCPWKASEPSRRCGAGRLLSRWPWPCPLAFFVRKNRGDKGKSATTNQSPRPLNRVPTGLGTTIQNV